MRVVVSRSKYAKVEVDQKIVGEIDNGLVLLVGFTDGDNQNTIDEMVKKIKSLRIFDDENGVMNLSIEDIKGSILSISQFTLYADTKKGNRPSFIHALNKKDAELLYEEFNRKLRESIKVETGIFGADMNVSFTNNGPVTILLER